MNPPKVSVIIPVYNTEEYIGETLNSIINQTLKDIEIIVINDGSTDNSLQIINEYAQRDSRITVFTQVNQGQSMARNFGILQACGDYLYFMDSDDLLDECTLELCFHKCETENLDFVIFNGETIKNPSSNIKLTYNHCTSYDDNTLSDGLTILKKQLANKIFTSSPCLSFIKANYLRTNNLKFYPNIIHEDQLFTFNLYLKAKRISSIPRPLFKRRIRNNSTMTQRFSLKNMNGYFTVSNEILKHRQDGNKVLNKTIDLFLFQMLNATSFGASTLPFIDRVHVVKILIFKYFKYVTVKSLLRILLSALSNKHKSCL